MRSGFARLHPLVDLTFFVLVLAFAMFLSHPAVQLAGLVCAALFALRCTGRGFGRRMAMLLPLMLLAAVVNPLVSHQGVTVLFRFPSGNACTLESVLYGISAAVRLGTAVLWFMGWNAVMTSDKFVYLFGRILPSLSLTLSMGLRFVPRLLRRTRETADRLGVPAAALTFDTHPDTLVSGHSVPLLNTPEDRAALMRGADDGQAGVQRAGHNGLGPLASAAQNILNVVNGAAIDACDNVHAAQTGVQLHQQGLAAQPCQTGPQQYRDGTFSGTALAGADHDTLCVHVGSSPQLH